ncbi:GNAT family N-acetyltransferase, partial [Magnetococcales bacterium HHB-1]
EHLQKTHDRKRFDCGDDHLNNYLKRYARQNDQRGTSRVFVATLADQPDRVVGFYTLSSAQIDFEEMPLQHRTHLPRYPIPAARIGRLAVDRTMKGQGLGGTLLFDAVERVRKVSVDMGILGVVVDAKNEGVKSFYEKFGFFELVQEPALKLFLFL